MPRAMPGLLRHAAVAVLIAGLTWSAATPAAGHRLEVFAVAEGRTVSGQAYFPRGGPAADVPVSVTGPDGTVLVHLKTDAEGRFAFTAERRTDHRITVRIAGHEAHWTVPADELPKGLPGHTGASPAPASPAASPSATPPPAASPAVPDAASATRLEAVVEEAVARQIRPLREELRAHDERIGWTDVLGGLGWVAGIFGALAWVTARRRAKTL